MENKTIGFGLIVMAAVAVLIGLAFWPTLSPAIGQMTKTFTSASTTITLPAGGATTEITPCGQKALTITIINATGGETITATNYTLSQSVGTDGYLAAKLTVAASSPYASKSVNYTCTYEPKGYIEDGGSRAIIGLVAIAMALLIMIAAMPNLKNGLIDFIKGN